jgi:hypothetical protein
VPFSIIKAQQMSRKISHQQQTLMAIVSGPYNFQTITDLMQAFSKFDQIPSSHVVAFHFSASKMSAA